MFYWGGVILLVHNKKTHKQFVEQVLGQAGAEYTITGTYQTAKTRVGIRHDKCGHEWEIVPDAFFSKKLKVPCPKCRVHANSLSYKEVKKAFKQYGFTLLEKEYKTSRTSMAYKCNKGHKGKVSLHSLRSNGAVCRECRREKLSKSFKLSFETVKNYFEKYGYELLSETYVNAQQTLTYRCDKGHIGEMRYGNFQNGKRCPICEGNVKKTTEQFTQEVFELVGIEYEVLGEYVNRYTHIKLKHNICGHIYKVGPGSFLYGKRCPKCKSSKGETAIGNWLEKHEIKYQTQYRIKECRDRRQLPFDFALFNGDNLVALIEYDGEQHYRPVDVYDGKKGFELTKKRDEIKNCFCKENNLPLIRIPYWDFDNIDTILEKELSKLMVFNFDQLK